jgi:hypothetical protein
LHIHEAADVIPDEEGGEFASLEAARAEARASLRDLAIEDMKAGVPCRAWCVEISTHDGTVWTASASSFANIQSVGSFEGEAVADVAIEEFTLRKGLAQ